MNDLIDSPDAREIYTVMICNNCVYNYPRKRTDELDFYYDTVEWTDFRGFPQIKIDSMQIVFFSKPVNELWYEFWLTFPYLYSFLFYLCYWTLEVTKTFKSIIFLFKSIISFFLSHHFFI